MTTPHPVSQAPQTASAPHARTLLLALCLSAAGHAATAAPVADATATANAHTHPPGTADAPQTATLPEVTVTAAKQGTTTFDTPASVGLVDGAAVEREGLHHLDDMARQLPNVYFSDFAGGTATITIRGLGYGDEESDVASIGMQIDGAPLPLSGMAGNLFDLEHIEVLRGPQSLLHGQGHIGGLVALRSRDPGSSFGGSAQFDAGSDGRRRASVALDLPLAATTALRLSAGREESDGHVDNVTLHRDDTTGWDANFARMKLLHRDHAGGELRLSLHHLNRRGGNDFFLREGHAGRRQSVEGDTGTNDIRYTLFSGEYTRPLDAVTHVTVSAGLSDAQWRYWTPTTLFGATNGFDMQTRLYQAEARIQRQASTDSPFDWMVGVHAARSDLDRPYLYDYVPYFRSATASQIDGTTLAAFGEAGWHVTPRWRLAAGLRLTRDRRELDWGSDQNGTVDNLQRKVADTVWLPQLTLEYRPDAQQFAWAKVSRGYKAAGFNLYATGSAAAGDAYAPEYAQHAEIGYRIKDAQGRWQAGATLFHTRLRDQQVITEGLGGSTLTDNAGRSHSQGIELDASVRPHHSLEVAASLGYVKAVYDDYLRGSTDYAGRQFAATPRHSYGLSVDWRPADDWALGLSARRIGKVYLQTNRLADDAYTLVDAHLTWYRGQWTLGFYGKNLTDAHYLTRAIGDGMGGTLVATGTPRTVGVRLGYDF